MEYFEDATNDPVGIIYDDPMLFEYEKGKFKHMEVKDYREIKNKEKLEKLKKGINYKGLKVTNYIDNVKYFYETQPFFYDKSGIFWFWNINNDCWEIVDEIDVMNSIDKNLNLAGETVNSNVKRNYLEAFKRLGRLKHPKDAPSKWIQFKNKVYSLESGKLWTASPEYFFCNPIPHRLGFNEDTPIIDKMFKEWVGEKYIETLKEIIAYCCYSDYPIQSLFCFIGSGCNGKSTYLKLLSNFIGSGNISSTELDSLIDSRFETFKLYKKLVCMMGETNFGIISKTSLLKKLVGGDVIGFEKKNKDPFDAYNYAKILISSNSLPTSLDTSDGYYRRWQIIDFPNQFNEGKDIIKDIPEREYENLARKIVNILPRLLKNGYFTNQGDIEERKNRYIMSSNPLSLFLRQCCILREENDCFVSYKELHISYLNYLKKHKKRKVSLKEFKSTLEEEGFWAEKCAKKIGSEFKSGYWIDGISLKHNWKDFILDNLDNLDNIYTSPHAYENEVGNMSKLSKKSKNMLDNSNICENVVNNFDEKLITHHKCFYDSCNDTECNLDDYGVPYCRKHWELMVK